MVHRKRQIRMNEHDRLQALRQTLRWLVSQDASVQVLSDYTRQAGQVQARIEKEQTLRSGVQMGV